MPSYWIVHEIDGIPRVYIQEASAPIYARLAGSMAGILDPADFVEMHTLDDKTARKVPKAMQGRLLSPKEVAALLERLG